MEFSQPGFGLKNMPKVEQTNVSFGLNSSSRRGKDDQMSMIKGLLRSPKKCKFDSCSLALPPEGHCNYRLAYCFYRRCSHGVSILSIEGMEILRQSACL